MPAYITMFNWTEQGLKNIKETTNRAKAGRGLWEAVNGRLIAIWWTQGEYDGFILHETPDDETTAQLILSLERRGNVRTKTLRAFNEEEMERIIQGLP